MRFSHFLTVLVLFVLAPSVLKSQNTQIIAAKGIYTVNDSFEVVESMVIRDGKIVFLGTLDSALKSYPLKPLKNHKGYIYPGFIDAHCHLLGFAKMRLQANLVGVKSIEKVISVIQRFYKKSSPEWILGNGWDQNLWKSYPDLASLDKAYPNTPVFLKRIDGHAAWINTKAMDLIHLDINKSVEGGAFVMKDGKFMGVLLDNAVEMVEQYLPEIDKNSLNESLSEVTKQCLSEGVTAIADAGLEVDEIKYLIGRQHKGVLPLRIHAMLSASNASMSYMSINPHLRGPRLQARAMKFYLDGALGSHGALMKRPYCDRNSSHGLQLISTQDFYGRAIFAHSKGMQVCAHAIGDSAAKVFTEIAKKVLVPGNDYRWRMEHAQIVEPNEMHAMREYGLYPSVQPTHATSDAKWAASRICNDRLKNSYAYRALLDSCGIIALGTDFPVESTNPLNTFYSAVFRKDRNCKLKTPFFANQALTRMETLRGMTIWAAKSNFMETKIGSIEIGKLADFVVLNVDLMNASEKAIRKAKVKSTFMQGVKCYTAEK